MTTQRKQLIYVAGYGRSGSTLLDTVLSNHPAIFGGGELTWLFQQILEHQTCSCGTDLQACPVWTRVVEQLHQRLPHFNLTAAADLTLSQEQWFSWRTQVADYVRLWDATWDAMADVTGCTTIVDSSKNSRLSRFRLELMLASQTCDVAVIHLIRDPRAVMYSTARGSNRKLEAGDHHVSWLTPYKGLMSWAYSNSCVDHLQAKYPQLRLLRIRYEDFVQQFENSLNQLSNFLQLDFSQTAVNVRNEADFDAGHGVAGNRMRRNPKIKLRYDDEWSQRLPWYYRRSSALVRPWMNRYGYK